MLQKRYQKVFTQTQFQQCQLLVEKNDSLLISTKIYASETLVNSIVRRHPQIYNTYVVNQKEVTMFSDFRLFDGRTTMIQGVNSHNQNQSLIDTFTCGKFEVNENLNKYLKVYLGDSIVNLIDTDTHKSVVINLRTTLRVNSGKNRLYSQDYKINQERFDFLGILPKIKTNSQFPKEPQIPLLDLHQTSFPHLHIENLSFINEQNLLLHLSFNFQSGSKNIALCKYNILNNTLQWKYHRSHHETFFNRNVHVNQNSFLNGTYSLQNRNSMLQLFDYRMEGPALKVLTPALPKIADFNHIERIDNSFKFISLFTQNRGAINSPFIFDIRFPQNFQMIAFNQLEQKLFFAMKIKYQKPYLFAIQRQYQNCQFKNTKVSKYQFYHPNI